MLLTEMDLKQNFTRIVPYMHSKYNSALVETDSADASDNGENKNRKNKDGSKPKAKYWFMNLAYRWRKDIEKLECAKFIYDMQDSILFIFCSHDYSEWFVEEMEEKWSFKKRSDLQPA